MRLVDTHCHVQSSRFDEDREATLARALEVLEGLIIVGDDLTASEAACTLVRPGVYAVVGMHPYHAEQVDDACIQRLRELAARPGVVAIGETGLDYFNEFAPRPAQRIAFERQIALAAELHLPLVIHNREADNDTLAILREHAPRLPAVIMHCFGSGPETAAQCVEMGFFVSFAGNLTFPKAQRLRDAAAVVPPDRLLVETDAPYLAPQPLRGRRCEPAFVLHTAAALAQIKGMPPESLFPILMANTRKIFRL